MQFVSPLQGQYSAILRSEAASRELPPTTDVTRSEVTQMITYLRKAKDRAVEIRDRAPAGSYMENVLARTIDGITLELSQLEYLLALKPVEVDPSADAKRRMRPAI